jgi:hypothetical protein
LTLFQKPHPTPATQPVLPRAGSASPRLRYFSPSNTRHTTLGFDGSIQLEDERMRQGTWKNR